MTFRHAYLAALDPWKRARHGEVERLLKLSALTTSRVVISDNQAMNSLGVQRLLARRDVYEFLSTPDGSGAPPLAIALRKGSTNFEQVAQRLVTNRVRPAIFPWMGAAQQAELERAYLKPENSIEPLLNVGGDLFRQHLLRLDQLISSDRAINLVWSGLEEGYVAATANAIRQFRDTLIPIPLQSRSIQSMISVCDDLLRDIELGDEVNRSNLYRIVERSGLEKNSQLMLRLKALDEPYHTNFARKGGYHSITGGEYVSANIPDLMKRISEPLRRLRPVEVFEIDEFPIFLDQVPLSRIVSLRQSPTFHSLLNSISSAEGGEERVKSIRDLLRLISGEIAKEPRGLRRLNKLRLHVLQTPASLSDEMQSAGLTLSDVVAAATKVTGLLAGETVGWLVGVFAIGGLLGTGAAVLVEQVSERLSKPHRQSEFQQVLQFLSSEARD